MTLVNIEYPLRYYPGLDRALEKLAGKTRAASGAGLGIRDLCFTFRKKEKAKSFAKTVKKTHPVLTAVEIKET